METSDIRGASMVEAALIIPMILAVLVLAIDLTRLFSLMIFQQHVISELGRLAVAYRQEADVPPNRQDDLIYPQPGENIQVTNKRILFWTNQLSSSSPTYHGKSYYTNRELQILNSAYGLMRDRNPNIYSPIPEIQTTTPPTIGEPTNCSIYFRYDNPSVLPNPLPTPPHSVLSLNRSRIFFITCRMPLIMGSILRIVPGLYYFNPTRSGYAYASGAIS